MVATRYAACLGALALFGVTSTAHGYTVKAGNSLVRPEVGGTFNFLRHRQALQETPQALLTAGASYDYAFSESLAVTAALKLGVADRYLGVPLAAGVRYRFAKLETSLYPYLSLQALVDLGVPLAPPPLHVNLGARMAGGVEYFITGNLGVAAEFALAGSTLVYPAFDLESSAQLSLGCIYKF